MVQSGGGNPNVADTDKSALRGFSFRLGEDPAPGPAVPWITSRLQERRALRGATLPG